MPRVGQNRKRDANEQAIVDALRKVGAQVLRLGVKDGPDLLVRTGVYINVSSAGERTGKYVLMEVKTARGKVTPGQIEFHRLWPEVAIVRTPEDALRAIHAL